MGGQEPSRKAKQISGIKGRDLKNPPEPWTTSFAPRLPSERSSGYRAETEPKKAHVRKINTLKEYLCQ